MANCRQLLHECQHQSSLDVDYPNMASATLGSSSNVLATTILPPSVQSGVAIVPQPSITQIVGLSGTNTPDHIIDQQTLIPEIHLSSGSDDILNSDGTILVSGAGSSNILGTMMGSTQSQVAHPVHPLVHPSGSISLGRVATAISTGGSNNVPTFSLDHNTPQIESGLQMLQSLEQGGHLAVSATMSQDSNADENDQSPSPVLSSFVGASPILEPQSQTVATTQASLLLQTTNTATPGNIAKAAGNAMIADNLPSVSSANVQNRKRRRTNDGKIL